MESLLGTLRDEKEAAEPAEEEFFLIRLPKEVCDRLGSGGGGGYVGKMVTSKDSIVFQDDETLKNYKVVNNHGDGNASDKSKTKLHDLLKVSLNRNEAVHLGKVSSETLICVPTDDPK